MCSSVITTKFLAKTIISVFAKKDISVSYKKNIQDQDGVAVSNYLKEKNNKELILIKKHTLKKSLLKILYQESPIKIKKKWQVQLAVYSLVICHGFHFSKDL